MSEIKDGGPAFPIPGEVFHYEEGSFSDKAYAGMTLRDYFAAKAMHAALMTIVAGKDVTHAQMAQAVAPIAYMMADAMLRAREN